MQSNHSDNTLVPGLLAIMASVAIFLYLVVAIDKAVFYKKPEPVVADNKAIEKRIKPEGTVCIDDGNGGCKDPKAAKATEPEVATEAADAAGETVERPVELEVVDAAAIAEETYNAKCMACHATGAAGAPKVGDAASWKDRIAQGDETLYKNAIEGINAMPPKGACMDCSDETIKMVVDFMVSKSK